MLLVVCHDAAGRSDRLTQHVSLALLIAADTRQAHHVQLIRQQLYLVHKQQCHRPQGCNHGCACCSHHQSQVGLASQPCSSPCSLDPIASVSTRSPLLKLPTVWPLGFGGRRGSRGGGGLFLRSWNSLIAPPTRLPPFFSSIQICKAQ